MTSFGSRRSVPLAIVLGLQLSWSTLAMAAPDRTHAGPTSVAWPTEAESPPAPTSAPSPSPDAAEVEPSTRVPPPRVDAAPLTTLDVAVGLSPEAPGSKHERALLDRLERTANASSDPKATVRRLRAGTGDARAVCRDRRDDLVVMIGYVPDREEPVVLAHDCTLDVALKLRSTAALAEPGLLAALWAEHDEFVRQGVKERRRFRRLGPGARAGIIAGVAVIVIGVAAGVLIANALRDEKVVIKVSP